MRHIQKVSISEVKKIKIITNDMINNSILVNMMVVKYTTINVIINLLLVNTMVLWNKSSLNWYLTLFWKKKKTADKYDQWDNNPYTPKEQNKTGAPTLLNLKQFSTLPPKPNITGN